LYSLAKREGAEALHRLLAAVDPASAESIDPRNIRRVVRALEIQRTTGLPASLAKRKRPPRYRDLRVGLSLPRPVLYARIDERLDRMLTEGLVEEVRALMGAGLALDDPPMNAIGYHQIARHLQGDFTLEEALARIRRQTRQLVRRQANWFKRSDQTIHWFDLSQMGESEIAELISKWIRSDGAFQA
jgi:tRNA dimethylallyltransferase